MGAQELPAPAAGAAAVMENEECRKGEWSCRWPSDMPGAGGKRE